MEIKDTGNMTDEQARQYLWHLLNEMTDDSALAVIVHWLEDKGLNVEGAGDFEPED